MTARRWIRIPDSRTRHVALTPHRPRSSGAPQPEVARPASGIDQQSTRVASRCRLASSWSVLPGAWRDSGGATAVEMALVLPVLLMFVLGVIQFGSLFFLQHQMVSTANDVVRRLAVGDLDEAGAISEATGRLASWKASFSVDVDDTALDEIGVAISVPLADAGIVHFIDFLGERTLVARAIMRKEF